MIVGHALTVWTITFHFLKFGLPQLSRGNWAVTLDIQDALLHVPILLRSRRSSAFGLRSLLPVSGSSSRSSRLPLGVLALDSHRRCLSESERDQYIPPTLVVGGEVKDSDSSVRLP